MLVYFLDNGVWLDQFAVAVVIQCIFALQFGDFVMPLRERLLELNATAVGQHVNKIPIQYTDLMGMDELYDLEADPYELENLIDRAASAALLEVLQTELSRLLAATR